MNFWVIILQLLFRHVLGDINCYNSQQSDFESLTTQFFRIHSKATQVITSANIPDVMKQRNILKSASYQWIPQIIVIKSNFINTNIIRKYTKVDHFLEYFTPVGNYIYLWKYSLHIIVSEVDDYEDLLDYTKTMMHVKSNDDFLVVLNSDCSKILLREPFNEHLLKVCLQVDNTNNFSVIRSCELCDNGNEKVFQVCEWDSKQCNEIYEPESYVETDFHGKRLKIASYIEPETLDDPMKKYHNMKFMRADTLGYCEIANILNFTFEAYMPTDAGIDLLQPQFENGTYTGVVGDIISGRADFSILIPPWLRMFKVLNPGVVYFQTKLGMATALPTKLRDFFLVLHPFELNVWLCVFSGILGHAIVITILTLRQNNLPKIQFGLNRSLKFATYFLRTLVNQPNSSQIPESLSYVRASLICWWLVVTVLITGYTSKMTANEATPPLSFIPKTKDEFLISKWEVFVPLAYHIILNYLGRSAAEVAKNHGFLVDDTDDSKLFNHVLKNEKPAIDLDKCLLLALQHEETFCVAFVEHVEEFKQHHITRFGEPRHEITPLKYYQFFTMGGYKKGASYRKIIDIWGQAHIVEGGMIYQFLDWSDYSALVQTLQKIRREAKFSSKGTSSNAPQQIGIKRISAHILLLFFGYSLCLVVFGCEILFMKIFN